MYGEVNNATPRPRTLFKFGLRQMFYATALIASGLALSSSSIWFSLFVLVVWGIIFYSSHRFVAFGFLLMGLIVVSLAMPTFHVHPATPSYAASSNRLMNVAIASLNYESAHGKFPTDRIVILDDGTELRHSWRIEILPFIEQEPLYALYDFKEPWNGTKNSKLETCIPELFSNPIYSKASNKTQTPFKLVNGPGTAYEVGKHIRVEDVKDGTSNTIGVIEDCGNPVHWMQPEEFTAEEAARAMNSRGTEAVHQRESYFFKTFFGSGFATMDGGTHWWPLNPDKPVQPGAFLIDDNHLFDADVLGIPVVKFRYGAWARLATYLLLIFLPAFYLGRRRKLFRKSEVTPLRSIATVQK